MFVFLVIHNVKCILRIKFSSVACLAAPYFPALPHKERHFLKINWNINVCFERSTNFVWNFLTLRRIQRDSTINFHTSSRSMDVILVRLQQNLNFLDGVLKSTHIPNFMKICPVGAELFHANRHGDANSRFSQFYQKVQKQRCTGLKWIAEYINDAKSFDLILSNK